MASSDAHSVMELGIACTVVPVAIHGAPELLAALPGARLVTGRGSYLLRLWTPLAKLVQRTRGNRRIAAPAASAGSRS